MSCFEVLKEHGYRMTPQRLLILQILHSSQGHISAEEIYENMKRVYPTANISTVYRTLELLEKLGLVTKTDLGDGILRFHHIEKGKHHHLICKKCGKIEEIGDEEIDILRKSLKEKYGFEAEINHLPILGICKDCL